MLGFFQSSFRAIADSLKPSVPPPPAPKENLEDLSIRHLLVRAELLRMSTLKWERLARLPERTEDERAEAAHIYSQVKEQHAKVQEIILLKQRPPAKKSV
ncbi:hypothetical protein MIND_00742100 [Mycena indigotica]|uniref:Uncharacterized protein n=1 Tax=Mycena indigotica TaxID=2126181 RepID=A0A8H6SPT7_9AGAR|nr:uncharacterized protein MIND_00742100 [Mycena indigotica]KAF7301765.1 hypothetical protein MIND_00742100 [Mycena indigotica]